MFIILFVLGTIDVIIAFLSKSLLFAIIGAFAMATSALCEFISIETLKLAIKFTASLISIIIAFLVLSLTVSQTYYINDYLLAFTQLLLIPVAFLLANTENAENTENNQ